MNLRVSKPEAKILRNATRLIPRKRSNLYVCILNIKLINFMVLKNPEAKVKDIT
jgi:hypothetical protein